MKEEMDLFLCISADFFQLQLNFFLAMKFCCIQSTMKFQESKFTINYYIWV